MIARLLILLPVLVLPPVLAGTISPAHARDLNIAMRDGGWETGLRDTFFQPFAAATGIALSVAPGWDGRIETMRAQLKANEAGWDILLLTANALAVGCDEGLLEKLDWSAVGGKDHYLAQAVSDCGVGAFVATTVLSWDREKFPATPGWAEFWDVAKVPGKRGLFRGPRGTLEFALLADGVAPADVYKVLRSAEGVDRAFRRLDQLRPFIVWWENEAQALQLLGSGEVLMTSAPFGQVAAANQLQGRNYGVQWAGGIARVQFWAIAKASPMLRQAQQFLYFAGTAAIQARLPAYGGLAKGVAELMGADAAGGLSSNPANLAATLTADEAFWRENADKLGQRFDAWLAR